MKDKGRYVHNIGPVYLRKESEKFKQKQFMTPHVTEQVDDKIFLWNRWRQLHENKLGEKFVIYSGEKIWLEED